MPILTRLTPSAVIAIWSVLLLGAPATAMGQQPAAGPGTQAPPTANGPTAGSDKKSKTAKKEERREVLAGLASKLNTSPEALRSAHKAARREKPALKFSQLVASNVIAHKVGGAHPKVTTAAILSGLKAGSGMTQTLESLGLSPQEAKAARADAKTEEVEAERLGAQMAK